MPAHPRHPGEGRNPLRRAERNPPNPLCERGSCHALARYCPVIPAKAGIQASLTMLEAEIPLTPIARRCVDLVNFGLLGNDECGSMETQILCQQGLGNSQRYLQLLALALGEYAAFLPLWGSLRGMGTGLSPPRRSRGVRRRGQPVGRLSRKRPGGELYLPRLSSPGPHGRPVGSPS